MVNSGFLVKMLNKTNAENVYPFYMTVRASVSLEPRQNLAQNGEGLTSWHLEFSTLIHSSERTHLCGSRKLHNIDKYFLMY
ncbi:unnamed protein product [Leptidea sinapis]|uniref:Uncharacterized protein n=1 Tax=Leptidea sinapis TaxID=189913 RepID=A0A5E4QRY0_9NEOP|nr:unnamed protein product [Leptidea sinapis]